jgi:uncharacterized protein (DUF1810 family)
MEYFKNSYSKSKQLHPNDKHNLYKRYVANQKGCFGEALSEIQGGQKSSCWMWYE